MFYPTPLFDDPHWGKLSGYFRDKSKLFCRRKKLYMGYRNGIPVVLTCLPDCFPISPWDIRILWLETFNGRFIIIKIRYFKGNRNKKLMKRSIVW